MDKPPSNSYGCSLVHVPDLRHDALHRDWRHYCCLMTPLRVCLLLILDKIEDGGTVDCAQSKNSESAQLRKF